LARGGLYIWYWTASERELFSYKVGVQVFKEKLGGYPTNFVYIINEYISYTCPLQSFNLKSGVCHMHADFLAGYSPNSDVPLLGEFHVFLLDFKFLIRKQVCELYFARLWILGSIEKMG
jgi:hypothetical protein